MSEGGREPVEARRTAGDPRADVDRTEALSERLFANAVGALELYIPSILANDSGCIGRSLKTVRPTRRSWPHVLEPPNAT
jgi:hypothetical protein